MTRAAQKVSGVILAACLTPLTASADNYSPWWIGELTYQLEREVQCEVVYYIRTKDHGEDGQGHVEARARCKDGREFDAFRDAPSDAFTIVQCAHAVCERQDLDSTENPV